MTDPSEDNEALAIISLADLVQVGMSERWEVLEIFLNVMDFCLPTTKFGIYYERPENYS
jgi:hypothetical protein